MNDKFLLRVWGARGSIPSPGPKTIKYGGNTSCLEVRCGDELIIIDAGSGIRELGFFLLKEQPIKASILFSHFHWDHIQGFPFFVPGFQSGNIFTLYGESKLNYSFEKLMAGQMIYPHFPVTLKDMAAEMTFIELTGRDVFNIGEVEVKTFRTNHPDGCVAYRLDYKGRSILYATDTEHYSCVDPNLKRGAQNVDCLIYDANYTDEEYCGKVGFPRTGWGHSTWSAGIKLAKASSAKQLILWHHDHAHEDSFIEKIEKEAQIEFVNTIAAREGLEIIL